MDKRIAIVEKYPTNFNYAGIFNFEFEKHSLVEEKKDKVLKRDIILDIDQVVNKYDYIILVGAEPCKFVGKVTSVTEYQGYLMDNKFLPLLNPMAVKIRPSQQYDFDNAVESINSTVSGNGKKPTSSYDIKGITQKEEAIEHIKSLLNIPELTHIAWDTETTALYPRDGYVLGISLSYKKEQGVYIDSMCIDDEVVYWLQELANKYVAVFHNAKFDKKMLAYHFGLYFPNWEDTMLMHYNLDETEGTHGLKYLAIKFTDLGDYDSELDLFKKNYCSTHKVLVRDFTYDLIPFEIMYPYACLDTAATIELFWIFKPAIDENKKLKIVYERLLKEGTDFLIDVEENGIPLDIEQAKEYINEINGEITSKTEELYSFDEVKEFEKVQGSLFNVNSPKQKAEMFFNVLGLPSIKKTATGADSTDAEVIAELAELHPLPQIVQDIMKLKKIKSTYLEKFINGADRDGRLRTGFNLHTVSSGRLSSSGKINAQQLPRDDKRPKKCIKASEGYKIVSQDLQTAEMYIAAVLSGDKNLQQIFIDGVDYHGAMAVNKFGLPCSADEVKLIYPQQRQDAKTISFEILYKLNYREPALKNFPQLKKWLQAKEEEVKRNGFLYSHFGRKRRLEDVNSPNRQEAQHTVRSGINFLVQSVASDVNLLAGIDMQKWIVENNFQKYMKIFGLVHDSILAEVHDDYIDLYIGKLAEFTQRDRAGMSIPGRPIGIDVEIGQSYGTVQEI
jgi:DNA polymerase I-like protein with 3'-5' exonuclease and polymerase domains